MRNNISSSALFLIQVIIMAPLVFSSSLVFSAQKCDMTIERIGGGVGPFDYNDPSNRENKMLLKVENFHFSIVTEKMAIMGGDDNEYKVAFTEYTGNHKANGIAADLSYTLKAFPNHHRALHAMSEFEMRRKGDIGNVYSADCFFKRAIKFRPNDPVVRSLYGIHFYSRGAYEDALEQFITSENIQPGDTQNDYNLGLVYFALGNYEKSREYADKAYNKGWPLQGLENKLKTAGH